MPVRSLRLLPGTPHRQCAEALPKSVFELAEEAVAHQRPAARGAAPDGCKRGRILYPFEPLLPFARPVLPAAKVQQPRLIGSSAWLELTNIEPRSQEEFLRGAGGRGFRRERGTGTEFAPQTEFAEQTPQIGCPSPFSLVFSISKAS